MKTILLIWQKVVMKLNLVKGFKAVAQIKLKN